MKTSVPPVLLVAYNRPDLTEQVVDNILSQSPPALYACCDGPRPEFPGDTDKVAQVRKVLRAAEKYVPLYTCFQSSNLGCGRCEAAAFDWFFQAVESGIILEDDCLPDATFYRFCAEMLQLYALRENVMQISGYNLLAARYPLKTDYILSNYGFNWGWASWRRAWRRYDFHMRSWPEFKAAGFHRFFPFDRQRNLLFDKTFAGEVDTWDYQWHYAIASSLGLSVVPRSNLVRNLGFRSDGTHIKGPDKNRDILTTPLSFPLKPYPFLFPDLKYDHELVRTIRRQTSRNPVRRFSRLIASIFQRLA